MTHNEILGTLEGLMPEINRTQDPEGVILKHASENNLSPAQMSRIAQYFNTAKTLNYMQKFASNRGGSFAVIDTEALEQKYSGLDKVARAAAFVAGKSTMQKAAGVKIVTGDAVYKDRPGNVVMDIFSEHLPDIPDDDRPIHPSRHSFTEKIASAADREARLNICRDLQDEFHEKAATFFEELNTQVRYEGAGVFAEIERDLSGKFGREEITEFMDKAAAYAGSKRTVVERWDGSGGTVLIRDTRNVFTKAAEAMQAINAMCILGSEIEDIEKEAATATEEPPTEKKKGKSEGGKKPQSGGGSAPKDDITGNVIGSTGKDIASGISGSGNYVSRVLSPLDSMIGPSDRDKGMLSRLSPDMDHQKKIDSSLMDARLVTNLQRLLLTDPIISKADPDKVASLFTSMVNTNPEVAGDRNMLRYALREALEYDSVPLTTHQTMLDMADKREKAIGGRLKNEESVYANAGTKDKR